MNKLQRIAPYLLLTLFTFAAYRNVLFTKDVFIPWDLPFFHVPHAVFASEALRNGELPLWDPNTYCGRPIYAQLQTEYFYPFRIASMLLVAPSPHVRMLRALEVELILHVLLAGVFTLWLARRLGMSDPAALLSAVAYPFGFFFASQAQHIGFIETASWIPLAWLSVVLLNEKPTFGRFALLSIALALSFLAGFAPGSMIVFVSVGLLALLHPLLLRSRFSILLLTIGGAVAAALLAAIQLLPTIELTRLSIGHLRSALRANSAGLSLDVLQTLFRPNALGALTGDNPLRDVTTSYIYCGLLVLGLAVIAVVFRPSRMKFAVVVLAVVSGVLMFGDSTPAGKAFYALLPPFIQGPYYPTSWMPVFSLCVALVAGFGLHLFRPSRWMYVVVLIGAADLIWFGSNRAMNTVRSDTGSMVLDQSINGETTALSAMREATKSHFPPYRIDGRWDEAWASWTLLTGVPSANGIDPLSVERLLRARLRLHKGWLWAISTVEVVEPKLLSLMNVRYLMSSRPLTEDELNSSEFTLLQTFPGRFLYENPKVLPRFFFVEKVVPSKGQEDSLEQMGHEQWDPARMAVVEGIAAADRSFARGKVQVVQFSNQEVVLDVHAEGDAFLSSSEVHYPGWKAYIDGAGTPLHYSNAAFRGLFVPAGDHRIVFKFRPMSLLLGAIVTSLSLISLGIGMYLRGSKTSRQRRMTRIESV